MNKIIFCCFILITLFGFADEEPKSAKIVYFTLPKGGSQLFRKAISLITKRPLRKLFPLFDDPLPDFLDPADPTIGFHHLEPGFDVILEDKNNSFIKVIMIRDPRDVIISMIYWIEVMAYTDAALAFTQLPIEEQITRLILEPDLSMSGSYPFVFDTYLGVKCALSWMQDERVLVCRFEDLVGPQGGGSDVRQLEAINALAHHLQVSLSPEETERIAKKLFGDTITFRTGKIGAWRELYTPFHKEIFKAKMGQELINLGYEKDYNW